MGEEKGARKCNILTLLNSTWLPTAEYNTTLLFRARRERLVYSNNSKWYPTVVSLSLSLSLSLLRVV
jgi:hypothetical protein